MLHHVVFAKLGTPDTTCSSITDFDGRTSNLFAERFYAEGEEHAVLSLPEPFGYPNRASDQWGLVYMLMNHRARDSVVQVQYTVSYATGLDMDRAGLLLLDHHPVALLPRPAALVNR